MPNEDHHSSSTRNDSPRRYLFPGALIALAIIGIAFLALARDDDPTATSPPETSSPVTTTASTATRIPDTKIEVIARLREILQIREKHLARGMRVSSTMYIQAHVRVFGRVAMRLLLLRRKRSYGRIDQSQLRFSRQKVLITDCGKLQPYSPPIRSALKPRKGSWYEKLPLNVFVIVSYSYGRPTQSRGDSLAHLQSKADHDTLLV
jgi:hypothetical protein